MDIVDLFLTISILYIVYIIFIKKKPWCYKENFSIVKKKNNNIKDIYNLNDSALNSIIENYNNNSDNDNESKHTNNYTFHDNQFNINYRDIITIINDISSYQNLFNKSDKPINVVKPSEKKVKNLVKYLVKTINEKNKDLPQNLKINSEWNDVIPRENVKSGWEKQMNKIGLPGYEKYSKNSTVKLIEIRDCEGVEIDNESLITCIAVLQKNNIKDKILIKVNFWINKCSTNDNRYFFDDDIKDQELDIVIEKIDILGYYTLEKNYNKSSGEEFYNFKGLNDTKNDMLDQDVINKELEKKYKERSERIKKSIENLNEEDKQMYK